MALFGTRLLANLEGDDSWNGRHARGGGIRYARFLLTQEATETADGTWVLFNDRWISLDTRVFVDAIEVDQKRLHAI